MPADEFGEKTEQPTERRRSEARQKGNVARSADLVSAGNMLAVAFILFFFGYGFTRSMAALLRHFFANPLPLTYDRTTIMQQLLAVSKIISGSVLSIMFFSLMASILFNMVQVGFLVAPESLQPKLSRLNPLEGVKRIFSLRGLVKLAVSLGKLIVLVVIAAWSISVELERFVQFPHAELTAIMPEIGSALVRLAFQLSMALILLGLLDFGFQKWKYEQDLRMTKQEIRDEMKQMEGDPLMRQRRKETHRKLAQAREIQQVKNADVVITNPTQIAVALKYDPEKMAAPTVVAKGMGEIAARIRRVAIENGVPIIERKPLARALYRDVKVGHTIPVELYEVFVEIMAYVYRLSGKKLPYVG